MQQSHAPKWWQTGVIYQIYPRSFMDSNGDGIGDLAGVMQKLDYLQWLGVDAIWFSPTYPSPMADFGYDVADYTAVHPDFGTLDDFDALLAAAKERGIRIMLDLVPNHTSEQHAWFRESRSSRDNAKRDWYIWRDAKPDGSPPNNWMSVFGGSAWEWDEATGQYYLHSFLKEQPDLNWQNPEVAAAIHDVVRFWLKRGVSGFRVDVIDFTVKDWSFPDEPPNPDYNPETDIPRGQFLNIYSAYQDGVHEVMRGLRAVFDEFEDTVVVGEVDYNLPLEKMVGYYGDNDQLHMPFNFPPIEATRWGGKPSPEAIQDYADRYDAAIGPKRQPNWVLGNHDVSRLATRVGERARLYAMMQLTMRGTPYIYYGEELGMTDVPIAPEQMQDPFGINVPGQTRDPERTPMPWSDAPNGGFTAPDVTPWLPLGEPSLNVATQQADERSMLTLYRSLLLFRRAFSALTMGLYYPIVKRPSGVVAYMRQFNDQRLVVVLNFNDVPCEMNITDYENGHIVLSTELDRDEDANLDALTLRPYEGVLITIPAGTMAAPIVNIDEA